MMENDQLTAEERLRQIVDAWNDPGTRPGFRKHQKFQLRRFFNPLFKALEAANDPDKRLNNL